MKEKVLLGMSGGVDSSVSAVLLKQAGYEVIGITLELLEDNKINIEEAKKICDLIGIEHITCDLTKEFKQYVIDDFIECYKNCKTPNPCIECNRFLKFGFMFQKAKELRLQIYCNRALCKNRI